MDNFNVFGLQVMMSFVSFYLIARYYIWPKLMRMPAFDSMKVLVATHMFRHLGLVFFVIPQIVSNTVPEKWSSQVAYGDLLTTVLAIISFVLLEKKSKSSVVFVWLFSIVGLVDLLSAYVTGFAGQAWNFDIGSAWYIPTFIVPALIIIHIMVIMILIKSRKTDITQ
jgi:hypothetical protein